jgi:predicted O-linked N-acetylglucosamine transferase (SPINDLY family)
MKPDRNAPCPCGSGKKYKKCCGAAASAARAITAPSIERAHSAFTLGNVELALSEIQALLKLVPNHPDGNHLAGLIYAQIGRLPEARASLERAATLTPDNAFVHSNLATVLLGLKLPEAAIQAGWRALELDPKLPDAHNNLANALKATGDPEEAIRHFRDAAALAPDNLQFQENLAGALIEASEVDAAETVWRQVLDRAPVSIAAMAGLGDVAMQRKEWEVARDWYQKAIAGGSGDTRVFNNLGLVQQSLKDFPSAREAFKRALKLDPANGECWFNYGYLLEAREHQPAALEAYKRSYDLGFRDASLMLLLLGALAGQQQVDRAYALALTMMTDEVRNPAWLPSLSRVFGLACDFENLEKTWSLFDEVFAHDALSTQTLDISLLIANYSDFIPEQRLQDYHRAWGRRIEQEFAPFAPPATPRAGDRLRLGYLSADLRLHSVGYFIQHVLTHHDRSTFEVTCYSNTRIHDEVTEDIERHVDHFHMVRDLTDSEVAARIQSDGIDILIDLSGHTANHRLPALAHRPAPMIATWIGYLNTTGLAAVDYRISDPYADPEEGFFGTERLLRLPHSFLCFGRFPDIEIRSEPPCLRNGHVTFASFNNLLKLNRSVIRLWARILMAVPESKLVIMGEGSNESIVRRHLAAEFVRYGVEPVRVEILPHLPRLDYLRYHNEVDLLLDTFPFNGGTVTAGSLWMGVPVLTLVGSRHRQRVTYSMLKNIGIEDTITWGEEEYVARAVELAGDPERLAGLRRAIPAAIRGSILCDPARFTREYEAALLGAWQARAGRNPV